MTRTLALGGVRTAVLSVLRNTIQLTTYVAARIYPDSNGDVPEKPIYPYVQFEGGSESTLDTMGDETDLNISSEVRFTLRIGSQTRSNAQVDSIKNIMFGALDRQQLTVSGYAYALCTYEGDRDQPTLEDTLGGVITREKLVPFLVTVNQ